MRTSTGHNRATRAWRARVTLALAAVLALLLLPQQPSSAGTGGDEATFVSLINDLRASHGLPRLRVDGDLTSQARRWASVMARDDQLKHAGDLSAGVSADWDLLGENVGTDTEHDVQAVFDAFVASPPHLANLLDARFDYVGVGVAYGGAGELWTTQRFMSVRSAPAQPASAPDPAPTTAPAPPPAPAGGAASGASSKPAASRPTPTAPPTTAPAPTTAITEAPVLATRPLSDGSSDPGLADSDTAPAGGDPTGDAAVPAFGSTGAGDGAATAGPGTPFAGLTVAATVVPTDLFRQAGATPLAASLAGAAPLEVDPAADANQPGADPGQLPAPAPVQPGADRHLVAQVLAELTGLDG